MERNTFKKIVKKMGVYTGNDKKKKKLAAFLKKNYEKDYSPKI
jgi:hypothetical protein